MIKVVQKTFCFSAVDARGWMRSGSGSRRSAIVRCSAAAGEQPGDHMVVFRRRIGGFWEKSHATLMGERQICPCQLRLFEWCQRLQLCFCCSLHDAGFRVFLAPLSAALTHCSLFSHRRWLMDWCASGRVEVHIPLPNCGHTHTKSVRRKMGTERDTRDRGRQREGGERRDGKRVDFALLRFILCLLRISSYLTCALLDSPLHQVQPVFASDS